MLTLLCLAPVMFSLLVLVRGAVVARGELDALEKLNPQPLTRGLDVIIPARNEAQRLAATLEMLLAEPCGELRVWVYDDCSTDDTASVVRTLAQKDARLRLIAGSEEPKDGYGKPLALARAVDVVGDEAGDLFLFLDADVHLSGGALGALAHALEQTGASAMSGTPRLVCESAVEHLFVPAFVSLVAARHRPSRIHDDKRSDAFLNGQLILVRRDALEAVGGWRAAKDTVLEDVAMARLLKAAGRSLRLADLRPLAATRMYTSWSEVRAGFGKNAVEVMGGPMVCLMLAALGTLTAWGPGVSLVASVVVDGPIAPAILAWGAVAGLQAALRTSLDSARWPVWLTPVTYLGVAFVLVDAARKAVLGGEVSWRGRRYDARR